MKNNTRRNGYYGFYRMSPEIRTLLVQAAINSLLEAEPDMSTERLIQMVIDITACRHKDVILALKWMSIGTK